MASDVSDPALPLWRAAQALRVASCAYAVGVQVAADDQHTHPRLSWLLIAVLVIWSGIAVTTLAAGRRRELIVFADTVIAVLLMFSSRLVSDESFWGSHQTLPTTLWVANAVVSAAIMWGPWAGVAWGFFLALTSLTATDELGKVWTDAVVPVLVTIGLVMGVASAAVRRANEQLSEAIRIRAASAERERLAREVHDGVLQVLALMRRRGSTADGELGDLARLAGEQEQALRVLLSESATPVRSDGVVDLRGLLRSTVPPGVELSAPAADVLVPAAVGEGLNAAVRTALANVERHAGADARAYVLVEDLGDEVVVTVRDDGVGIEPGRLHTAESEGRMGVSKSIRGRVAELGGQADLETAPGEGTEWELRVPIPKRV